MHLAVLAGHFAVGVEHQCRVMIQPGSATFEHTRHQHHIVGHGGVGVKLGEVAGNLLGQREVLNILHLAEIQRVVQFGQHDQLCPLGGKTLYGSQVPGAVGLHIGCERMLYYSYFNFSVCRHNNCIVLQCSDPPCFINVVQSTGTILRS